MKLNLFRRLAAVLAVWSCLAMGVQAAPISTEGRTVLCRYDAGGAAPGLFRAVEEEDGALRIRFDAPAEALASGTRFAVQVESSSVDASPRFVLNGRPVDLKPLRRTDGWVVRLPARGVQAGENELTVRAREGALPAVDALQVFSLQDTFEEVHFGLAFTDASLAVLVQPAQDPLQLKYDALKYDLTITLNMTQPTFNAVLRCDGKVVEGPLSQVVLDFDPNGGQLAVSSVDNGNPANPLTYTVDSVNKRLRITLPSALATNDTFTVRVAYAGRPATGKVFADAYNVETHGPSAVPVVYTFSEPYGARQWWPCKDVPEDKALVDLHITCPSAYFPVSNGKLVATTDLGNGTKRYDYSETFPVATYLVSICCSNYSFVQGTYTALDGVRTMTVGHYLYPENLAVEGNAAAGTIEAMEYFARTFGEYPFLSEKYVTASHNDGAGMEHQTCTSMPGADLDEGGLGRRNVHELAHMWFGDLVTMNHFDHLWLNEGFATYCEALFYEQEYGKAYYTSYVTGWDRTGISNTTALVNTNADSFAGSVVYRRGGFVLHMLRHVVGDDVFFAACRRYLKHHEYGTALTEDLENAFEADYGQQLDWFFDEWVYRAGRPRYTWSWNLRTAGDKTHVDVAVTQTQTSAEYVMPIDIRVTDLDGVKRTFVVWNDQKSQTLSIDVTGIEVDSVEFDPDNNILKTVTSATGAAMPVLQKAESLNGGTGARLAWTPGGGTASGFQIVMSENLVNWTTVASPDTLSGSATDYTVTGLLVGHDYYFRIRAFIASGQPSPFSDTYGCRFAPGASKALIVDGYDRWDTQGRGTSHPWAAWHGVSVAAYGAGFDTVANEQVESAAVNPGGYDAVLWLCGEESTTHETFSAAEQGVVETYLKNGGKLFVSGAEIAWDLDNRGSTSDKAFFNNYLKAAYAADDSADYSVYGEPGRIFDGLMLNFDNGTAGIYFADFPDVLTPNGGMVALRYDATKVAGLQFEGSFPSGAQPGKLVYLGFGFETIHPESARDAVMARVLDFFGLTPARGEYGLFIVH